MLHSGVRQFGDPVLREKCKPIANISKDIDMLIKTMMQVMETAQGVGLAAPQVGVLKRLVIYAFDEKLHIYLNPRITASDGEDIGEEGCLSLAGIQIPVKRAETVTVEAMDRYGEPLIHTVSGLQARIVQHEVDHLDGILIIDHVPAEVRHAALDQYEEIKKREY